MMELPNVKIAQGHDIKEKAQTTCEVTSAHKDALNTIPRNVVLMIQKYICPILDASVINIWMFPSTPDAASAPAVQETQGLNPFGAGKNSPGMKW